MFCLEEKVIEYLRFYLMPNREFREVIDVTLEVYLFI